MLSDQYQLQALTLTILINAIKTDPYRFLIMITMIAKLVQRIQNHLSVNIVLNRILLNNIGNLIILQYMIQIVLIYVVNVVKDLDVQAI